MVTTIETSEPRMSAWYLQAENDNHSNSSEPPIDGDCACIDQGTPESSACNCVLNLPKIEAAVTQTLQDIAEYLGEDGTQKVLQALSGNQKNNHRLALRDSASELSDEQVLCAAKELAGLLSIIHQIENIQTSPETAESGAAITIRNNLYRVIAEKLQHLNLIVEQPPTRKPLVKRVLNVLHH